MKIVFLCQGLKDCTESVGSVLLESLADPEFTKFQCLSAFASLKGVTGISDAIEKSKQHINHFSVIVGIDLDNTSKEALDALLKLDIGASIYYTTSPIVFHPKVYLFAGKGKTRLIVGSSNITQKGLFQNVEASLKVDITMPDPNGEELLKQANAYLNPFFDGEIENLQKLTPELITLLLESELISTEAEKKKANEQMKESQKKRQETTKADVLKLFPPVKIQTLHKGFKIEPKVKLIPIQTPIVTVAPAKPIVLIPQDRWAVKGKLLWRKKLTPRDLQIVSEKSAPTGVISLTQAGFRVDGKLIDLKTYFKEEVFGGFIWQPDRASSKAVATKVKFMAKIAGKDFGQFELTLRHNPEWESKEGNYTTGMSWGALTKLINNPAFIGKAFSLYSPPEGQKEPFYIEIDGELSGSSSMAKWFG
jgi:HKD family nuclease